MQVCGIFRNWILNWQYSECPAERDREESGHWWLVLGVFTRRQYRHRSHNRSPAGRQARRESPSGVSCLPTHHEDYLSTTSQSEFSAGNIGEKLTKLWSAGRGAWPQRSDICLIFNIIPVIQIGAGWDANWNAEFVNFNFQVWLSLKLPENISLKHQFCLKLCWFWIWQQSHRHWRSPETDWLLLNRWWQSIKQKFWLCKGLVGWSDCNQFSIN